jgi:hypothetical protein
VNKIYSFLFLSSLVLGCATTSTTPSGNNVVIITSFSPEDAAKYNDIGVVTCEEDLINTGAYEFCRNSLRNQAAERGGNFILVEDHHDATCILDTDKCINMTARVYKAKTPQALPSNQK